MLLLRSFQEAGPADEEAQCGGSLYETNVMAGENNCYHSDDLCHDREIFAANAFLGVFPSVVQT